MNAIAPNPPPRRLGHLVAGTDLSEASEQALQRALLLAGVQGARLTLAHVVPQSLWDDVGAPLAATLGIDAISADSACATMAERLQRRADEIADRHGLQCEAQIAVGRPTAELARMAATLRADLLVVGARGAHPLRDLLGTTAQKLLRLAPCPVLVIRQPPPFDYARVLAPTDFSTPAHSALLATAALLPHAHLMIAHAFELPYDGLMRHATVDDAAIDYYRSAARQRLYLDLAAWADAAGIAPARRTLLVEHGYPPSCIDRWIAGLNVDLLALAARGKSELEATLLGSVSSMVAGPFLIRYNDALTARLAVRVAPAAAAGVPRPDVAQAARWRDHVIICGYGRIGQSVANFLEREGIAHVALDLDPARVRDAHAAGEPVFYGDATEADVLEAVGLDSARLLIVSHDDAGAALKLLHLVRARRPSLPVMVRTRDESRVEELRRAGATEVVPETLEAGMMIVAHALMLLEVPLTHVVRRMRDARSDRYRLLRELFHGGDALSGADDAADRLHSVRLPAASGSIGRRLDALELERDGVELTALLRQGRRILAPAADTCLAPDDVLVLFGPPAALMRVETRLLS